MTMTREGWDKFAQQPKEILFQGVARAWRLDFAEEWGMIFDVMLCRHEGCDLEITLYPKGYPAMPSWKVSVICKCP